jgi:predicted O-methyltransferase YrrM
MLTDAERAEIDRLWMRKVVQDQAKLPKSERHRNLEPDSAELLVALASGLRAKRLVEIGGSSGLSTIALSAAARRTGGKLTSIEIEPVRQAEARGTIERLGSSGYVDFVLGDAHEVLRGLGEVDFALIDAEKDDYIRLFDALRVRSGGIVVADNIVSHDLGEYVAHVRSKPGVSSVTLAVGKGLEVTRVD